MGADADIRLRLRRRSGRPAWTDSPAAGWLTCAEQDELRLLRDMGGVRVRERTVTGPVRGRLADLGLVHVIEGSYGHLILRLTMEGYDVAGRREGRGKTWTVSGGLLGDDDGLPWPRP